MDLHGLRDHIATGVSAEWGRRVRDQREALGFTQREVVALLDGRITVQTISKIETGEFVPRDYLKLALALVLQCEVGKLFPMPTRKELAPFRERVVA